MIDLLLGIGIGGVISWATAFWYYRKSQTKVPDWAIPLIEKLPQNTPTEEELLKLFQNEITKGNITPHPLFKHVACPSCHAPLKELEEQAYGNDYVTIVDLSCPHCGWSDKTEV